MRIRKVKTDGINERFPLVVDDCGMPIDRINLFILEELRNFANTTVHQRATMVMHIERWAEEVGISLSDELSNGCLSSSNYFISLMMHLESKSSVKTPTNVVSLRPEKVTPEYFNQRIDLCMLYFTYFYDQAIKKKRSTDTALQNLKICFERLIKKLDGRKIKGKTESTIHGLTTLQQQSLFHALNLEGFLDWSSSTQLRNRLIICLYYETGIRRAELLSLVIGNCHTKVEHPYIHIAQNVKYPDPRSDAPHIKTLERIIPISQNLAQLIEEYKHLRSKSKEARKQPPFLILSSKSPFYPLATSSLHNVFDALKTALPDVTRLSPHTLRHTKVENLDRYLKHKKYPEELKKKIKNTLGGWSPNSNTSLNYEKLATQEEMHEALESMSETIEGEMY